MLFCVNWFKFDDNSHSILHKLKEVSSRNLKTNQLFERRLEKESTNLLQAWQNCQATGTGTGPGSGIGDWDLGLGLGTGHGDGNLELGIGNGKMGMGNREYPYPQSQEMTV